MVHLAVRPEEEIYPVWPGEDAENGKGEGGKKQLDNLIHDIMDGCLDETVWAEIPKHPVMKQKVKRKESGEKEEALVHTAGKKQAEGRSKRMKLNVGDESGEERGDNTGGDKVSMNKIVEMIGTLSTKFDAFTSTFGGRLDVYGGKIEDMEKKIESVQSEVRVLKEGQSDGNDLQSRTGDVKKVDLKTKLRLVL